MKILVVGATGLVGSALIRELKRENKDVTGISSKDVNLLNRSKTFEVISELKPDVIIDAAAKVGGIGGNNAYPVEYLSQNLQIQCNLMDAAHEAKVPKFIFLGSSCIYPRNCSQPIKEDYLLTGELEQTNSAYAIAKIAGIELIKSYRKEYNYSWISVMPANLYGPNDNFSLETGHVLPSLIRKFVEAKKNNYSEVVLWGSGKPLREFLHVDDLAKAVLVCLEKYNNPQQINIGSGVELSISDLAQKILAEVGFKGKITWNSSHPDGTPRKILDTTTILSLGWKPLISLDEGIKSTVEWYLQNNLGAVWH
jgi:GDP-L-fucose synthase